MDLRAKAIRTGYTYDKTSAPRRDEGQENEKEVASVSSCFSSSLDIQKKHGRKPKRQKKNNGKKKGADDDFPSADSALNFLSLSSQGNTPSKDAGKCPYPGPHRTQKPKLPSPDEQGIQTAGGGQTCT
jgi:hypothetical protein